MHEKLKNKRWISKVSISFQTIVNLYWRKSDRINFPNFCSSRKYFGSNILGFSGISYLCVRSCLFSIFLYAIQILSLSSLVLSGIFYWFFGYAIEVLHEFQLRNSHFLTLFACLVCMHLIAWKWFSASLHSQDRFRSFSLQFSIISSKSVSIDWIVWSRWFLHYLLHFAPGNILNKISVQNSWVIHSRKVSCNNFYLGYRNTSRMERLNGLESELNVMKEENT